MPAKPLNRPEIPPLPILYQDAEMAAIQKPSGLVVHRSEFASDRINCISLLRKQLGQKVFPIHRLDRGASGVLLFGLNSQSASALNGLFSGRRIEKCYLALVRGYLPDQGIIDYPLADEPGQKPLEAQSEYHCIARMELPFEVGRYSTARYSIAKIIPATGRTHQIRKHFAHIRHPLIGDINYGDGKHNLFFRRQFDFNRLALHAISLSFLHPGDQRPILLKSPLTPDLRALFQCLPINSSTPAIGDWNEFITNSL